MKQYRDFERSDRLRAYSIIIFILALFIAGVVFILPYGYPFSLIFWFLLVLGIFLWVYWNVNNIGYRCSNCGHEFSISMGQYLMTIHAGSNKLLDCPQCHKRSWMEPRKIINT